MSENYAKEWWVRKRKRFNLTLAFSAIVTGLLYVVLVGFFPDRFPEHEITFFTILFNNIALVIYFALANACYSLGYFTESIFKYSENIRELLFIIGTSLGVVPFLLAILGLLFS